MKDCIDDGDFGSIWFRILHISDSELPIVKTSFYKLNTGRALKEGSRVYPRFPWLRDRLAGITSSIRIRYARWKIGAKR